MATTTNLDVANHQVRNMLLTEGCTSKDVLFVSDCFIVNEGSQTLHRLVMERRSLYQSNETSHGTRNEMLMDIIRVIHHHHGRFMTFENGWNLMSYQDTVSTLHKCLLSAEGDDVRHETTTAGIASATGGQVASDNKSISENSEQKSDDTSKSNLEEKKVEPRSNSLKVVMDVLGESTTTESFMNQSISPSMFDEKLMIHPRPDGIQCETDDNESSSINQPPKVPITNGVERSPSGVNDKRVYHDALNAATVVADNKRDVPLLDDLEKETEARSSSDYDTHEQPAAFPYLTILHRREDVEETVVVEHSNAANDDHHEKADGTEAINNNDASVLRPSRNTLSSSLGRRNGVRHLNQDVEHEIHTMRSRQSLLLETKRNAARHLDEDGDHSPSAKNVEEREEQSGTTAKTELKNSRMEQLMVMPIGSFSTISGGSEMSYYGIFSSSSPAQSQQTLMSISSRGSTLVKTASKNGHHTTEQEQEQHHNEEQHESNHRSRSGSIMEELSSSFVSDLDGFMKWVGRHRPSTMKDDLLQDVDCGWAPSSPLASLTRTNKRIKNFLKKKDGENKNDDDNNNNKSQDYGNDGDSFTVRQQGHQKKILLL